MELFFLRSFDLLARRVDGRYRVGRMRGSCMGWPEYAAIVLLGFISGALGLGLMWLVLPASWLIGGLLDPIFWKKIYGISVGRKVSLVANLDVPYLFALGWVVASLLPTSFLPNMGAVQLISVLSQLLSRYVFVRFLDYWS
jgi:hypothetical protein